MRCSHLIFLKKFQKLQLSKRVNTKSNLLLHKMMRIFPFPPRIKFTYPYHNYYGSSFYRFIQLELLICTSTSIFKHFLYTNMPYICNAKIGCNFITLSFQHTQLQHFCPEILRVIVSRMFLGPLFSVTAYRWVVVEGYESWVSTNVMSTNRKMARIVKMYL